MNTRLLMTTSSLFLGIAGLAASFAPQELLAFLGSPAAGVTPVLIQLTGAAVGLGAARIGVERFCRLAARR